MLSTLLVLSSPAAFSTVRRSPALPARVGRMGHPPVTWPTRFPRETSLASPCAPARAHSKWPYPRLISSRVPLPRRVRS